MKSKISWGVGIALLIIICCICFSVVLLIGLIPALDQAALPKELAPFIQWLNPVPEKTETPTPKTTIFENAHSAGKPAFTTLKTLQTAEIPKMDWRDLAARFQGLKNIPATIDPPSPPYYVGDALEFWVNNDETNEIFQAKTNLGFATQHAYYWIQTGQKYKEGILDKIGKVFEDDIYPTDRRFFGSEWTPGVDGDPHIYIIYSGGMGGRIGGYFSSIDSTNPKAHEYSNGHETIFLNANNEILNENVLSTLAHEFQHMIHWNQDRNEDSWMNEGFSMLAEMLNGYASDINWDKSYSQDPDLQLNDWPNNDNGTGPHYGAAFLFSDYFLDRFGENALRTLTADPLHGLDSVDHVLSSFTGSSTTEQKMTADDLFQDWAVANYLQDKTVGDGRYTYHNYDFAPKFNPTETLVSCPFDWQPRTVHQYGVDYIKINCKGAYRLEFEGLSETQLFPANVYSGEYVFWSRKGDESDMTLTRQFDFSSVKGPISMTYHTWYDLEKDYDYIYLTVSEDGENWKVLMTPSCKQENRSGNNLSCGYNGTSDGWKEEKIDLSAYAGKNVFVRFEYITDGAVNGEGLLLDDISIPEIGYNTDFEKDDGGWEARGFARVRNILPQTWRLSAITNKNQVESIVLDSTQHAVINLNIPDKKDEEILAVSGTTRFTRELAQYRYRVVTQDETDQIDGSLAPKPTIAVVTITPSVSITPIPFKTLPETIQSEKQRLKPVDSAQFYDSAKTQRENFGDDQQ